MNLSAETRLLDYSHGSIVRLIIQKGWHRLDRTEAILATYNFIRDDIAFGYNEDDAIPASQILADGYGQCNTKGILFMALLRAQKIECRFHGFTIHKQLQKGAITGVWYALAPREIVHSWVELEHEGRWINLEGFILDLPYLNAIQKQHPEVSGAFCGYGVDTDCLSQPAVEWLGGNTYVQNQGIVQDFGVFADPDSFFMEHGQRLWLLKRWVFRKITRHAMNRNVARVRGFCTPKDSS